MLNFIVSRYNLLKNVLPPRRKIQYIKEALDLKYIWNHLFSDKKPYSYPYVWQNVAPEVKKTSYSSLLPQVKCLIPNVFY